MNTDIEVLKLRKFISKIYIDNFDKESDEINWIDISDDKESDERYHIGENDEERVTDDIEVLKPGTLSLQKNMDNLEKEYDKSNQIDIIDDKEYDKRDNIGEMKENELESEEQETDEIENIEEIKENELEEEE